VAGLAGRVQVAEGGRADRRGVVYGRDAGTILIDRKGVIRHTQVHEYFLPQVLDNFLAEQPGVGF
jgi:hypothetical protein